MDREAVKKGMAGNIDRRFVEYMFIAAVSSSMGRLEGDFKAPLSLPLDVITCTKKLFII
ncbi:MAG: hypothetical protein ACI955_000852 [Zhongshania sp.]